jgi:hypothetical protein
MNPFSKKFLLIVNVQNATGSCIPNKIRHCNELPEKKFFTRVNFIYGIPTL